MSSTQRLDTGRLLAWLVERASATRSPLAGAIYLGLALRIRRGDFDLEEAER